MKTIGVVTGARSDYGICSPILRRIQADPSLKLQLMVTGMHLSPEFGLTARTIENDGFKIGDRVEVLLSSDTPEGIAKSMGVGMLGFAQVFARARPDLLLVVGDRFEMHAAALTALPFKIPVAHIHGGELTEGAIDNALRYSMTKLSHLHFVATQEYANRVIQTGEEPWRVTVSGAPSLDNLKNTVLLTREELTQRFGLPLGEDPLLLVTFHPVTLEYERTEWQTAELLAALKALDLPMVFTMPNADTSGRTIVRMVREFTTDYPRAQAVDSLGTQGYFSVMSVASAMVGNSSSGIVEAASFALPVVNIGTRQLGRTRGKNVIDVDYRRESILQGIRQALDRKFREGLRGMPNLYGAGTASEKIVEVLRQTPIDKRLLVKKFHDLASGPQKDVA